LIRSLDRIQIFIAVSRACFHWGSYRMLLDNEAIWLVELEYRVKMALTFDPTVGSRSKVYRGFERQFSLG